MSDEWTMADGFAPASRVMYCQHPKACSAPPTGRCGRCQHKAAGRPFTRTRHGAPALNADSTPTYVDADFDDLAV